MSVVGAVALVGSIGLAVASAPENPESFDGLIEVLTHPSHFSGPITAGGLVYEQGVILQTQAYDNFDYAVLNCQNRYGYE